MCHSRVPVYEGNRNNLVGILLVKTLIRLDPSEETPVSRLLYNPQYVRKVTYVTEDMPLYDALNDFQTGKSK